MPLVTAGLRLAFGLLLENALCSWYSNAKTLVQRTLMTGEFLKNSAITTWWDDDGFVRQTVAPEANLTLDHARDSFNHRLKLAKETPHALLMDISGIKTATRDCREFGSTDEAKAATTALALVTKSLVSRLIGNFFLGLNKPPYPTRIFASDAEAVDWLKRFSLAQKNGDQ